MKGVISRLQPAILEDATQLEVVAFDFKQMVLSILSDPELMEEQNFVCQDLCAPQPILMQHMLKFPVLQTSRYASAYQLLHVDERKLSSYSIC